MQTCLATDHLQKHFDSIPHLLQIFAIDTVQERLDLAKEFGATPINGKNKEEVLMAINKGTEGRGVDCALEAVGAQPTIKLAFDLIRMGGNVHLRVWNKHCCCLSMILQWAGCCGSPASIELAFDLIRMGGNTLLCVWYTHCSCLSIILQWKGWLLCSRSCKGPTYN